MHLSQQPGFLVESIHFSCSSPLVVQMSIPHLNYYTTFATGFLKVMQSVPQSRARMVLSKHKVTHITPPPPGRAHSASSHPPLSQAPRRKPRLLATIPARTNTGADSRNPLDRGSVAQASCTSGQFQPTGPGSRRQAQCGPGVDLPLATCAPPNAFAGPAGTTLPRGSCGNRHARFRWLRAAQFLRVAWFLRTLRGCELGGRCWRRVGAGVLAAGRAWAGLVC